MDFLVEKLRFLGLNDREVKVFTTLSTFGRMKMIKIASRSGLPRTTVDAIVRRLVEQGLVMQERVGNHFEYAVELHKVADTLVWIEKRLRPRILNSEITSTQAENIDEKIVTKEPDSNVVDIDYISKTFAERAGDRLRILLAHTPEGIDGASRRLSEYVDHASKNGTKLEILTCLQVADTVQKRGCGEVSWSDPNSIRLNVVPSAYCRSEADIIIFPERVLVRTIRNDAVRVVLDGEIVEAMKHLLEIACETGWSVNLSAWLNEA